VASTDETPEPAKPAKPEPEDSPGITTAVMAVGAIGAIVTVGAFVVFGLSAGFSVGIGAAVATANLYALGRIIDAYTGNKPGGGAWKVFGLVKIFFLFGGVWLLLSKGVVDPIPFVVGLGSLPVGISISSMLAPHRGKHAR
jgi:hypothetical protein